MNKNNHKPTLTVESLRKSGAPVRVYHERRLVPVLKVGIKYKYIPKGKFNQPDEEQILIPFKISAFGGRTSVVVDTKEGKHYEASAICSRIDNYNKKRGLKITLSRIQRKMLEQ